MVSASRVSLARSLKLEALANRHVEALLAGALAQVALQEEVVKLKLRVSVLDAELEKAVYEKNTAVEAAATGSNSKIDHTILVGKTQTQARSLVGVSSHETR